MPVPFILAVVVAPWLALAIHELGHLVMALIWRGRDVRVHMGLCRARVEATFLPGSDRGALAFVLGGPLASGAAGGFLWALGGPCAIVGAVSALFGVLCLAPTGSSDGAQALALLARLRNDAVTPSHCPSSPSIQ